MLLEFIKAIDELVEKTNKKNLVINNIDQELLKKFYDIGTKGIQEEFMNESLNTNRLSRQSESDQMSKTSITV